MSSPSRNKTYAKSNFTSCSSSSSLISGAISSARANYKNDPTTLSSLRFSMIDCPVSPNRSISVRRQTPNNNAASLFDNKRRTCTCSPTNHPGSFRCAFHKTMMRNNNNNNHDRTMSYKHSRSGLNIRRLAMKNLLVRIGDVEGELAKRTLSALIQPSSHQLRHRVAFEPKRSRLSIMSTVKDL